MSGIDMGQALAMFAARKDTPKKSEVLSRDPDYYYVIPYAGQSNGNGYGEGMPLPATFDAPHPRIKQLARRTMTKPTAAGGIACAYNDIIELDHCAHHVQNMSGSGSAAVNHPSVVISASNPAYGTVGGALHLAKKLLPMIPPNAGILIVPCCRGGSGFTTGTDQTYSAATGAPEASTRWGVTGGTNAGGLTALYMDLRDRTRAALSKNPKNILLAVLWMQGEFDLGNAASHKTGFEAQVAQFISDMNATHASQCLGMKADNVPWLCGDTTDYWKTTNAAGYTSIYETTYGASTLPQVKFVRFMTDENGANVGTNDPLDDPDIAAASYYGSASRTSANWTSSARRSHFGSWSHRGIIAERFAAAIIQYCGRLAGLGVDRQPYGKKMVTDLSVSGSNLAVTVRDPLDGSTSSQTLALPAGSSSGRVTLPYAPSVAFAGYNGRRGTGQMQDQGWVGPEYQANTSTIISGSGTMPSNTTAGAVTHPDGNGGFTWRFSRSAASTTSYSIARSGTEADLIKLFTFGGNIEWRMKITSAWTVNQYVAAFYALVQKTSLTTALQTGLLGTDNGKVGVLSHFLQQKVVSTTNSIVLSAHQNGGNVDMQSIAFDNNYHTYRIDFTGGGSNVIAPSIDGVAGTARAAHYTPATYTNYGTVNFTNITSGQTSNYDLDYFSLNIYQDDGSFAVPAKDQDLYVVLQANTRNHTITLPDFVVSVGTALVIDAANTGSITVTPPNANVLIKKLGGSLALPTSEVITRASGAARAQYKYVQTGLDGKTWERVA